MDVNAALVMPRATKATPGMGASVQHVALSETNTIPGTDASALSADQFLRTKTHINGFGKVGKASAQIFVQSVTPAELREGAQIATVAAIKRSSRLVRKTPKMAGGPDIPLHHQTSAALLALRCRPSR